MSSDNANNGDKTDAQHTAVQAVSNEEHAMRADVAHLSDEASASQPDSMDQSIPSEADSSAEFMQQCDEASRLADLGLGPSKGPSGQPPATKRSRQNSQVLKDNHGPSSGHQLPYALVDGLVFKDQIPRDQDIDPARAHRRMLDKIGPHFKLCGAVTAFRHPESFVDQRLVGPPGESLATVDECERDETLYPNDLITGAVIGCEPDEADIMTDAVFHTITGLAMSGQVGRYKIVGLYTGMDLSCIQRSQFKTQEDFTQAEVELAQNQGQWLTKFAVLAKQLNIPLSVFVYDSDENSIEAFDVVMHLLQQVGLSKTHRICFTQFLLFPEQAELILQRFPKAVFGLTRTLLRSAETSASTQQWLTTVPWEHFLFESQAPDNTPFFKEDKDKHNDSADCLAVLASQLADFTGEHSQVIIHRMTMTAIVHYGLLAVKPTLLEGTQTPTTPPAVNDMTPWQYQEYLLSRPGGLAQPTSVNPEVIEGIVLPEVPWYVLQDTPSAPPEQEIQAGPLPDIQLPQDPLPDLRQTTTFVVNDQTDRGFEYLKKCDNHDRRPGSRFHATVRMVVADWHKVENDPKETKAVLAFRKSVGNRSVDCLGKMHLVCSAARWTRHHATTVVEFIDKLLCNWDRVYLEQLTRHFFDDIRTLEVARVDKAVTAETRGSGITRESIKFSRAETLLALRWWPLRCEPARAYFLENINGPARYDTAFLSSPGVDASLRDSFVQNFIGAFTERLDQARLRYFVEEVTKEFHAPLGPNGAPKRPPWVRTNAYSVDYGRTYWSNKVVLMDAWSRTHFGPNLRKDIDAAELDSDPIKALEAIQGLFFGSAVEQIILFYGKDALDKSKARELWEFYPKVVDHLTRNFGRARVYIVTPAFVYYCMKEWKEAVHTAVIMNEDLKRLATVVTYPMDMRLMAHYDQYGADAGWPNEALSLQDRNGALLKAGVKERKRWMVDRYSLELWAEEGFEPEDLVSEEDLVAISDLVPYQTVRHFGVPTVKGTKAEEDKSKSKEKAPSGSKPKGLRGPPPKGPLKRTPSISSNKSLSASGGHPVAKVSKTPVTEPVPPAPPSIPMDHVQELLKQQSEEMATRLREQMEAFMAEHERRLQAADAPSSSRKVPWLQPAFVAPKPAPLPKPKPIQRLPKANPPANSQKQRTYVRNSKGYSPLKSLVAEMPLASTEGRRPEGPHVHHQAAAIRVAVAASSIAAPATTTSPPTVAVPSSTTTSTTAAATTGTSAGSSASTGHSSGSSANSGTGTETPPAESLSPARQPKEGDEAMTADQ